MTRPPTTADVRFASPQPPDASTREFALTDTGNAEVFAELHGARVRFDYARKDWFSFDRHFWRPNVTAEVDRLALDAIRHRQSLAILLPDELRRKAALKWAIESENRSRREDLLALASKIEGIAVTGDGWDADPMLFGVENGVIDLSTGRLRDGDPEDYLTKVAPIAYDPSATCPRFEQFLREVFTDKLEVIDYLQRVFGYCLTGLTSEQVFWIWFGTGANGKSTLIELLFHHIFGARDYAWAMPFPAAGWSSTMSEYQKASLVGRRFVTSTEVTRRGHLNEELVKSLTGDDTLNARHPYGRPFQFVPVAKFFLRVNDKPIIRDESHGMWRRVKLIEFTQTFPIDTTFGAILAAEAPGILTFCVQGSREWQRDGLREPACVQIATAEYRQESDPLLEFFNDYCVIAERARVGGRELFAAYVHWCDLRQATADERLSQTAFGRRIKDSFRDVGSDRKVIYAGIGLQSDERFNFDGEDRA